MSRSSRVFVGLLLAGTLSLAACGDDDDSPEADAAADCSGGGDTVTVEIGEFLFDPTPVEVEACDEVVWTNTHTQAHTSTGDGEVRWNTGNVQPGDTSEPVLFETPGAHTYICALHPFMKGTVEVT